MAPQHHAPQHNINPQIQSGPPYSLREILRWELGHQKPDVEEKAHDRVVLTYEMSVGAQAHHGGILESSLVEELQEVDGG